MREFTFHDKARVHPGNRGTGLRALTGKEIRAFDDFFQVHQ
jgi:hypothetical protein